MKAWVAKRTDEVKAGDICAVFGIEKFDIGDTIADFENPEGLATINVDEPTMNMLFTINNSPFFGKEGKFVTSRHVRERLFRETEKNLALRVEETNSPDALLVYGRGILHLSILIETMRREGYELGGEGRRLRARLGVERSGQAPRSTVPRVAP